MEWTRKNIEKENVIIGEIVYREEDETLFIDRLYISTDSIYDNKDWFNFLDKIIPYYKVININSICINKIREDGLNSRGFRFNEEENLWIHKNL